MRCAPEGERPKCGQSKAAGRASWCTVQPTGGDEVVGRLVKVGLLSRRAGVGGLGATGRSAVVPLEPRYRCACLGVQLTSTALVQIVVTVVFSRSSCRAVQRKR